jgi:hypothetical protein
VRVLSHCRTEAPQPIAIEGAMVECHLYAQSRTRVPA